MKMRSQRASPGGNETQGTSQRTFYAYVLSCVEEYGMGFRMSWRCSLADRCLKKQPEMNDEGLSCR